MHIDAVSLDEYHGFCYPLSPRDNACYLYVSLSSPGPNISSAASPRGAGELGAVESKWGRPPH